MTKGEAFDTLRVTWSLAIEEQFYLVWPLVVWLTPRRMLKYVALAAVAISLMVRWSVFMGLTPPVETYSNTFARLDGLGLGAFLALWIPETEELTVKRAGLAVMALAVPATIAMGWFITGHWAFYTLVSLCFAGLLCVAVNLRQLEDRKFLRYTGKVSYCLYLVHVPVITLMGASFVRKYFTMRPSVLSDGILLFVTFAICYGVADISWRFFESKILRLKSHFEIRAADIQPPVLTESRPGDAVLPAETPHEVGIV
jgi:peptidoglycan/LPS O-acetylase OafA/YrhL